MAEELCRQPALVRLDEHLREETGLGLLLLLPRENEKLEVATSGGPIRLPEFCRLMQGSDAGRHRCSTCRSLTSFAAFNRGLIQHSCHGGISVLAAPVVFPNGSASDYLVVCSCAFVPGERGMDWRAARRHAAGASVDLRELRRAYRRLPRLRGRRLAAARRIVDIAAAVLSGLLAAHAAAAPKPSPVPRAQRTISDALHVALGRQFEGLGRATGAALVHIVAGVVRQNPAMPCSVADIARAAHLSPNHFSALFRKHMGHSFSTFVAWTRIERAQELLRDLSLSIREVAARAGFDNANYFARRFRQKTGISPRRWRSAL